VDWVDAVGGPITTHGLSTSSMLSTFVGPAFRGGDGKKRDVHASARVQHAHSVAANTAFIPLLVGSQGSQPRLACFSLDKCFAENAVVW